MEREIDALSAACSRIPQRPFAAVIGGAKVSRKIGVLEHLMDQVDTFVIGGGMANTFLVAQGKTVGKSLLERDRVEDAAAHPGDGREAKGVQFVLPTDVVVAKEVTRGAEHKIVPAAQDPELVVARRHRPAEPGRVRGGPEPAQTVFWNGPLGVFEVPTFGDGTRAMARFLADKAEDGATVVVGGGDSVAAVEELGLTDKMTHISHRRRRLARVPRGPGAAGHRRAPGSAGRRGRGREGQGGSERVTTIIELVDAREILDSRGNPTLEVEVVLDDGVGRAGRPCRRAPRPAPTRRSSCATATRRRYGGKGVLQAVATSSRSSRRSCSAWTPPTRRASTSCCIDLDGTPNKGKLGANAILGVSLACAHAAAAAYDLPLYRYLGGVGARPCRCRCSTSSTAASTPLDSTDFQEFMVMPVGRADLQRGAARRRRDLPRAARRCSTTRATPPARATRAASRRRSRSNEAAIEVVLQAIEQAGYQPGEDVAIALDPAITELVDGRHRRRRRADATGWPRRAARSTRRADRLLGRLGRRATRSSRSRTAWPRTTGPAGRELDRAPGRPRPARRRRPVRDQPRAARARHRGGRRQRAS